MMKKKICEVCEKLFTGQVNIKKRDLWLIGALCLFAGIVYGLVSAPWTHGVTIGSYNGNHDCYGLPENEDEELE